MESDIFSLGVIFCEILSGKSLKDSVAVGPELAVMGHAEIVPLLSKAGFPLFFIRIVFRRL